MSWHAFLDNLVGAFAGGRTPQDVPTLDGEWRTVFRTLDIPAETFHDILRKNTLTPHFHYRPFRKPKRDGTRRELLEPDTRLKAIQRLLVQTYLNVEKPHPAAVAYRRNHSIADHVWPHGGAEFLIAADVQDFFPSTRTWRIEKWWQARVDDSSARLFTLLTTHRNGLPQGAPTSPALSNLVNLEMDTRLAMHLDATGGRFTRYCDDMVFSWPRGAIPPGDFGNRVRAILHEYDYALHPSKGWCEYHRHDEPTITGLVVKSNGSVQLSQSVRRKMGRLSQSNDPKDVQRLLGYLGYQAMVHFAPAKKPF